LYTIKIIEELFNTTIFDYNEKRRFIQTLIIVTGIIVAINFDDSIVTIFSTFIITSLAYLIALAMLEKSTKKSSELIYHKFALLIICFIVSICFSIIIFTSLIEFMGIYEYIVYGALVLLLSLVLTIGET